MLGHKSNLSKFEKIEIISSIFSDHNAVIIDINYKKKVVRHTNTWRLSNTFLNNKQVTAKIRRKNLKKFLETNDDGNTTQNLWDAAKTLLRGIYSNTILPQETRKISKRQLNFTPKTTGKRTTTTNKN